ncbi:MAG: acnA [Chloroflexi bacterium]|nr:acnA [Chloroflexota bacterium]
MAVERNPFGARATLSGAGWTAAYFRLAELSRHSLGDIDRLPFTIKILLENVLRRFDGYAFTEEDVRALAGWSPADSVREFPFLPSRVILQDFTGVPAVVDLAAMRSAVARLGGDPQRINPLVPADLVIDHSVQVDSFGLATSVTTNVAHEYERNGERYALLRWAQSAFQNFRVVPPGMGIVHQVNLEYLAGVVHRRQEDGESVAYPDTLVGTDSHTTMVNGLGVLGWGVGGIEAEAVLLGQPLYLLTPQVIGFRLNGALPEGATATDVVLTVTEMLRNHGVVETFVEFFGAGLSHLSLADRATISNMCPEYGATSALFPVDDETLRYLVTTGRPSAQIDLVERYCKEQGLFRTDQTPEPTFSEVVELDLGTVEPSLAGPKRPQDRVALSQVGKSFHDGFPSAKAQPAAIQMGDGTATVVGDGSVVIAAITSCTNTSNPSVMIAAGLVAKKAVERGMMPKPYVKTSLAPGSRVVTDYLRKSGLLSYFEALRYNVVGYGCTTCIGNSGPLPEPVSVAIKENDLSVAAVLSGNRNFEGRIHAQVRAAYLASPPLVVAYALAGTVDVDLTTDPIGLDSSQQAVYLSDLWPTPREVREVMERVVTPDIYEDNYERVFNGDDTWRGLPVPQGSLYAWEAASTYVQEPPFFQELSDQPMPLRNVVGARALAVLGDSITTDHISPAASISPDCPAGRFLIANGVAPADFNSYGARRGNHEVMMRGTFGNIRLKNELTPDREGDWTVHFPTGDVMRIFDASERYIAAGTPLVVIAGKEYGSGSSRDWAAKGPMLLGVKAVIAETYERIHRSNLVGMGVLPLQFKSGEGRKSLGLDGSETYDVLGLNDELKPRQELIVRVRRNDGSAFTFPVTARVDSPVDVDYLKHGGVLQMVLRNLNATAS